MGEDFGDEILLQLDEAGVDVVDSVIEVRQLLGIDDAVVFAELAGDIQLEVGIDAFFLEFGEEIVEPLQLDRLEERILARIFPSRGKQILDCLIIL